MQKSIFALSLAVTIMAGPFLAPVSAGPAEDVKAAMEVLKSKAAALGAPVIKGEDAVAGKKK
jgi:hypothetical protein